MILLSRSEVIILLAVYKLQGNAYGITIREQVNKDLGRYWPFGVIYKTLKRLSANGYADKLEKILSVHSSIWHGIQDLGFEKKAK